LIECCFVDHPCADFRGEDLLDFNQRKLGNDQTLAGCLNERIHPFTSDLGMVQLRQSTGVKKVAGQLTFVSRNQEVRIQ